MDKISTPQEDARDYMERLAKVMVGELIPANAVKICAHVELACVKLTKCADGYSEEREFLSIDIEACLNCLEVIAGIEYPHHRQWLSAWDLTYFKEEV